MEQHSHSSAEEPTGDLGASHIHSVGALLRASRERCGEDLSDVSGALRISLRHLESIESGDYTELPGKAYAIGFVRAYADHLGLDSAEVVRRFKAETEGAAEQTRLDFPEPIPESGVPGGVILLAGLVVAALAYGGWYVATEDEGFLAELVAPVPEEIVDAGATDGPSAGGETQPTVDTTTAVADDQTGDPVEQSDGPSVPDDYGVIANATEPSAPNDPVAPASGVPGSAEPAEAAASRTAVNDESAQGTAAVTGDGVGESVDAASDEEVAGESVEPETDVATLVHEEGSPGTESAQAEMARDVPTTNDVAEDAVETASAINGPDAATTDDTAPKNESAGDPQAAESLTVSDDGTDAGSVNAGSAVNTSAADGEAEPTEAAVDEPAATQEPAQEALEETATDEAVETVAAVAEEIEAVAAREDDTETEPAESTDAGTEGVGRLQGGEGLDSQMAAVPADSNGAAADEPTGRVYGETGSDVRVVVRAKTNSWIQVRDDQSGTLLLTRLLRSGDEYRVPDRPGLRLLTGNAGALEITVDGEAVPPLGEAGAVRRDVALDAELLQAGEAVAP